MKTSADGTGAENNNRVRSYMVELTLGFFFVFNIFGEKHCLRLDNIFYTRFL